MAEHYLQSYPVRLSNDPSGQHTESLVGFCLACMVWRKVKCINLAIG